MESGNKKRGRKRFSWPVTAIMFVVIFILVFLIWALFVSGPVRIHEANVEKAENVIREEVPEIEGLRRNVFDYVTYQGYTSDTLYWFDETGQNLTSREMSTLDYAAARARAQETYGMSDSTIELAFGYTTPVYLLETKDRMLMLDYDTLEWVYERVKTDD